MKNAKSSSKVYIITFVVILLVLFIMFGLLYIANNATKKKREVALPQTPTTKTEEPVIVTNFTAPLSLIIGDIEFYGNYDYAVRYSGAKFSFKCTKYDETENKCSAGSAIMDAGTATVTLFEYIDDNNNYLNRSDEFYIIINDNYIILVSDRYSNAMGKAKILSRKGKEIMQIDNIATYYKHGSETYKGMYPNVENNYFTYYKCDNNKVKIVRTDLTDKDKTEVLQNVDEGICN